MSTFRKIREIDDKSKYGVYGWIRRAEQELELPHIPQIITSICILYSCIKTEQKDLDEISGFVETEFHLYKKQWKGKRKQYHKMIKTCIDKVLSKYKSKTRYCGTDAKEFLNAHENKEYIEKAVIMYLDHYEWGLRNYFPKIKH